ncbi:MAG: ATPase [Fervidobacterium sp.]|uniref:ATPase n=1 Tax=Fervidobacterium sp. TaxID=1871331 RepID=UPI00404ABD9E
METTGVSRLLRFLDDKPLKPENAYQLVNREKEVKYLESVALYQATGIYGIAGETGVGKTTVLNFVNPKDVFVRFVSISLRESAESILYDLIYSLSTSLINVEELSDMAKSVRDSIMDEVSVIKGFSLGASFGVNINVNREKEVKPRFNFFEARDKLSNMIQEVVRQKGKFLLVVDELDKEKKEDVLRIIDSIKNHILFDNFVVIFSLPFSIYREYAADRLRWNESGNLENIFKDIVFVEPLGKVEIKEMLIRRIGEGVELLEDGVLDLVADFSDGNPRDALWILTKAIYDNIHSERLTVDAFIKSVRKIVSEYAGTSFNLTDNQKRAIEILKDVIDTREKLVAELQKHGFKRTTAYSVLEQLLEKRILLLSNGLYKISGKFKYLV